MKTTRIANMEIREIDNERIEIRPIFHGRTIDNVVSIRNINCDLAGTLKGSKVFTDNEKMDSLSFYIK